MFQVFYLRVVSSHLSNDLWFSWKSITHSCSIALSAFGSKYSSVLVLSRYLSISPRLSRRCFSERILVTEDCSEPRHMNSVWSAEAGMTGKVVNPHTRFIQTSDSTSHYQLLILTFYLDILYRKTMHSLIVWLLYQRKCFCVVWRFPLVICAFFLANKWLPVGTVLKFKW